MFAFLSSQKSFSGDAVLTTTYADDYIVRGQAFQVQKRIALGSAETLYLVFDFSTAIGKTIFTLPIVGSTTAGLVYLDTFIADSYTGGSPITALPINSISSNTSLATIKSGVTPTGSSNLREYSIGIKATNQASGGAPIGGQTPKLFTGSRLVFKFVNQESAANVVTLGFTWYELTF